MKDWAAVEVYALTLPGATRGTSYGAAAIKAGGKAFVTRSREPDSFHVRSPHDEKAVLLETDPDTFWQTPHYQNWPGILVRFGSADPTRVELVIRRAWWDRLTPRARREAGERP